MAITSLRARARPDNLKNQARTSQSLARRIYLGAIAVGVGWIGLQFLGPLAFLSADGLIMQDREVISADFEAKIVSMTVRPGDHVLAGQQLGMLMSTQMLDLISDLTTRQAQGNARREQIDARLRAIQATMPAAGDRATTARGAVKAIEQAARGGYTTATRRAEVAHDLYDAEREAESLKAESAALESERAAVVGNLQRLSSALATAEATYRDGAILSPNEGIVGPKVASPGTVLRPGEEVAEVHFGVKYVVAYLPVNRFYTVRTGDPAMVSDGATSRVGRIERVEGLADTLPGEFRSSFTSLERRQLVRIAIDDALGMPLLAKVRITDVNTPGNLATRAQDLVMGEGTMIWNAIARAGTFQAVARSVKATSPQGADTAGTEGR